MIISVSSQWLAIEFLTVSVLFVFISPGNLVIRIFFVGSKRYAIQKTLSHKQEKKIRGNHLLRGYMEEQTYKNLGVNTMDYSNSLFKIIVAVVVCLYFTACGNYDEKCIEGNCTNGQGTYTFANGDKYVGEFKDHKANGLGTHTYPNGSIKRGIWKDNKIEKLIE